MSIGGFGLKREEEAAGPASGPLLPPKYSFPLSFFSDIEPSHAIFHIIDLADNAGNLLHFS